MVAHLGRSVAAELIKLRGLPSVLATGAGTVAAAAVLAAAIAASAPGAADPVPPVLRTVPYLQVGTILIGVLGVATEYAGRQIRTTLTATPDRRVLLAGKAVATLAATAGTATAAVAAGVATTWWFRGAASPPDGGQVLGAVLDLVLIGLLGFGLTLLLRSLIAPLVTMLGLVFVAPVMLGGFAYLPDRAGRLLYLPDADPELTPATGALVLVGWVATVCAVAVVAFDRRDA